MKFLVAVLSIASGIAPAAQADERASTVSFVLEETGIADLQQRMKAGELTAHAVTQLYLDRIASIDKSGPAINAIIELNPDALAIADQLDAERKSGKLRGPLHGVPVLIKDNIDTADRMHTTAGSLALAGSIAAQDSTVAANLRKAGAVILGKTNLSEWANFRSTHATSGWSGRGGQTRNPYALDRNPCGSSSGTGVAIATNLSVAGIGTETDGSIICPSSFNGLVGIKPTLGLVSRAGIVPIAHSQDTAGPMARSVADAVALLDAIAGADPRDALSAAGNAHRNFARFLDAGALKGARIGVVRKFAGFNRDVDALLAQNIATMKSAGAIVVDPVELPNLGKYDDAEGTVLEYEFKHDLDAYLGGLPASANAPRSLKELIAFNERESVREMPWFGQELFEKSQARGPLTDKAYLAALSRSKRLSGPLGIDAALKKHKLDALIAPSAGPAPLTDWVNGDPSNGGGSTSPAAVAGYPDITVPAGFVHGLPVGLSFFAGAWSEPKLIGFAYAFEQATHARRPPQFLRSIESP
jgi:amidase